MSSPSSIAHLIGQRFLLEKRANGALFGLGSRLVSGGTRLLGKLKPPPARLNLGGVRTPPPIPRVPTTPPPVPRAPTTPPPVPRAPTTPPVTPVSTPPVVPAAKTPMTFGGAMRGAGRMATNTLKGGAKMMLPLGLYGIPGINLMSDYSNARVYAQGAATGVAETLRNVPFGLGEKALEWKLKNSQPASLWDGAGLTRRRVMSDALARLKGGFTANDIVNPLDQALSDSVHSDWARAGFQTLAEQKKALAQHIAQQQQTANITR